MNDRIELLQKDAIEKQRKLDESTDSEPYVPNKKPTQPYETLKAYTGEHEQDRHKITELCIQHMCADTCEYQAHHLMTESPENHGELQKMNINVTWHEKSSLKGQLILMLCDQEGKEVAEKTLFGNAP
jgi:hypothetical protein